MAPALVHDENWPRSVIGGISEADTNLMVVIAASATVTMFIAVVGLCGCCGKKKKKKKEEAAAPHYLELDEAGGAGKQSSPAATVDTGGGSKKDKPASIRNESKRNAPAYVELDPPPLSPFKDTVPPDRKTQLAPDALNRSATKGSAKAGLPTPDKSQKKEKSVKLKESMKKSEMKGKETAPKSERAAPNLAVSVVKRGTGGAPPSKPAPPPPAAMQFALEDDPRYRSLYNLDEAFEGTMMKQSTRGGGMSMSAKPVSRIDKSVM